MKKGVKIGLIVLLLVIALFAIYYLTKSATSSIDSNVIAQLGVGKIGLDNNKV